MRAVRAAAAAAVLCALASAGTARAADAATAAERELPQTQRGGTYIEPPASVDPIFLPPGPNGRRNVEPTPETLGLRLRVSLDYPLRSGAGTSSGSGVQGSPPASPTTQLSVRWQPLADTAWFLQAGLYKYLRPGRQQPWNPDFDYAFGYEDWRPGTFSFVYSNYSGNRFQPDRSSGESRWNFSSGTWSAGYKFALPQALEPVFLIGDGDQATCRGNLNFSPRFTDTNGGPLRHGKKSASLGCRYTRPSGWFADVTAFAYPDGSQQQPWDPDFTYTFGYFDWRPGTLSIQYANYSGNRFPWNSRSPGQGTPRNGSLSVSWTTSF